jgi:hypothetical protein
MAAARELAFYTPRFLAFFLGGDGGVCPDPQALFTPQHLLDRRESLLLFQNFWKLCVVAWLYAVVQLFDRSWRWLVGPTQME